MVAWSNTPSPLGENSGVPITGKGGSIEARGCSTLPPTVNVLPSQCSKPPQPRTRRRTVTEPLASYRLAIGPLSSCSVYAGCPPLESGGYTRLFNGFGAGSRVYSPVGS